MIRQSAYLAMFSLSLLLLNGGCIPKMDFETIKQMRAHRPAELDRLDMLLGDWETSGQIKMIISDEVIHATGHNHAEWTCDRRLLIEHAELDMGPLGKMSGISIWTWDERAKKYRMWWFDSAGEVSTSVARYDEKTRTFHMKAKGTNPWIRTSASGTMKIVDDDTMEWTWTERDALGFITLARMKGSSHRR